MEIKPYIFEKSPVNGFNFYRYLHIRGGSGTPFFERKIPNGGEYDFIVFYASPKEMEGCDICERIWCMRNDIPFGIGKSIEEAYYSWENVCRCLSKLTNA